MTHAARTPRILVALLTAVLAAGCTGSTVTTSATDGRASVTWAPDPAWAKLSADTASDTAVYAITADTHTLLTVQVLPPSDPSDDTPRAILDTHLLTADDTFTELTPRSETEPYPAMDFAYTRPDGPLTLHGIGRLVTLPDHTVLITAHGGARITEARPAIDRIADTLAFTP